MWQSVVRIKWDIDYNILTVNFIWLFGIFVVLYCFDLKVNNIKNQCLSYFWPINFYFGKDYLHISNI